MKSDPVVFLRQSRTDAPVPTSYRIANVDGGDLGLPYPSPGGGRKGPVPFRVSRKGVFLNRSLRLTRCCGAGKAQWTVPGHDLRPAPGTMLVRPPAVVAG